MFDIPDQVRDADLTANHFHDLWLAGFCEAAGTGFTRAKRLFRWALVVTWARCPSSRALGTLEGALLAACILALVATGFKAAIVLAAHGWTVGTERCAGYKVAVAATVGVAVFEAAIVTPVVTVVKTAWLGALATKTALVTAWISALVATVVTAETALFLPALLLPALLLLLALVAAALLKTA